MKYRHISERNLKKEDFINFFCFFNQIKLKVRNNNNNNSSSNNNTNTLMNNQLEYTNCGEYLAYGAGNANGPSSSPTNMLTKQQQQQQQAYYQQQNQINHAHMYNTQSPVNEHLHGANGMTGMVNFNQTNLPVAGVQHPQQQLIQQQQQHHHIQHNQAPNMSYFNAPGQYPPSSYTSSNSFDFIPLQNVAPVTAYPIHATLTGQPLPGQMSSSITPPPSNNNTPTPLYHHHHHHHLHNLQPQKPLQESKKITAPCSFASRHNQITKKEIENYEDFTDSTNKMDGEEEDEDEEEDDEDEDDEEETDEDDEDDMDDEETSADEARYINPHYNPNSMRASKRKFNQAAAAAAAAGTANVSYVSSNEYDENDYEIKHNCLISNDDGLNGAGNPATGVGYMTSLFNSPSSLSSSSNQHPNKTANDNGTSKNGTKSDRNKSSRHSRQSKTQQQSSESQIVTKVEASDDAEQSNSNSHQQKDADQYQYQQQQQQQQAALMQTNPHMAGMINTYNLAGIMNDFDLVNLPLRELNKRLRFLPKQMAYNLKKRRRTLKNRKYAQNCRSKRLEQKSEMEIQNSHLKVEINRLQKHIEKLQNENILLKSYLSSSSSSSSNGSVLVTNDMISHTLENNNNNKLQAGLASTTISNKPSPKSLSTSTTASTTTSPTNRLTHIMSSTLK